MIMIMNISEMPVRKWTWQWLALLGLLGLIFHATVWVKAESGPVTTYYDEPIQHNDPDEIPVFYDYPWPDVVLVKRGCPVRGSTSHDLSNG